MKWKLVPVEPTPDMQHIAQNVAGFEGVNLYLDDARVIYRAMLESAPQPPKLSDERIKELSYMHMNMYGFDDVAFARAVEREILGENK